MTILVSCYQTFKRYSLFGYDKGLVRTRISGTGRERSELYNLLYSDKRRKKYGVIPNQNRANPLI